MYLAETRPAPTGRQAPEQPSKDKSPAKASPDTAAAKPSPDDPPAQWHRVLTLLANISLFIGTRSVWTQASTHRPLAAAIISVCYASILITGVLALVVRRSRSLARLDLVVLVTAVVLTLCTFSMNHAGGDEAVLTSQAAHQLMSGHQVYDQPWPWLFTGHNVALTPTMTGGYDFTYGYPPVAVLLTAPLLGLGHGGMPATAAATGALVVGTIVMWRMLPTQWRSAATMACLGFGLLPTYARLGYPAIIACVLLMPVVINWPRMGRGGRGDWIRAACLGAACAAQQLPWFLTPFLLAGIYALRRGELGPRKAAAAVGRILAVAGGTWLLINVYFIVTEPRAWLSGIALPLTQDAVLHGQGTVDISLYFTDGSSRLAWYSHASMMLAAVLLVLFVFFVRRLGPAATVLPWCAFFLATRSQDGYYLMMTPLWLAAAVTAPAQAFARAWQPRPGFLRGPQRRGARIALAVLLLSAPLGAVAVAATGTPPLNMQVTGVHRTPGTVRELTLDVTNRGSVAIRPHFTLTTGQGMNPYWSIADGPTTLPGHATAHYRLVPPTGSFVLPKDGARIRLRAFSGSPETLSSTDLRLPPATTKG